MIQRSPGWGKAFGALVALGIALLGVSTSSIAGGSLSFGPAVRVSQDLSEAWEPSMLVDGFGNIFMHARKATSNVALAPDERSPTLTRSQSWLWASSDGGKTFANMPGFPLNLENHEWGYEGDFALDGAGHLYFVDQTYADSTFTRWSVSGPGAYTMDMHRPFMPTAQPVDDRPFLAAHGDGKIHYIVNAGDAAMNPTGRDGGDAYGAGRFSVYRSTDGGASFETTGHSLNESGACRHAADAHSAFVYIACTNDGGATLLDEPHGRGTLWAFVSPDDGATYVRHRVGDYNADAETFDWPLVAVGPRGDVWVLHIDAGRTTTDGDGVVVAVTNVLNLYHSTDHGVTWTKRDITPVSGRYRWAALVVSDRGEIAFAIQQRPSESSPWRAYASIFAPGSKPSLTPLDVIDEASSPEPPSELMGLAFMPDRTLAVAWTKVQRVNGLRFRSVYFARSKPPVAVKGERKARPSSAGGRLPATGVNDSPFVALLVLSAGALMTHRLRRRV